jgi:hypothetical protein
MRARPQRCAISTPPRIGTKALADSLASMATTGNVTELPAVRDSLTDERRTKLAVDDQPEAIITPLTSHNDAQSQRGSNPCLHLERVVS